MGPPALGAHDNSLIACTISPAIGLACSALRLRVKSLDSVPVFFLKIPLLKEILYILLKF